jgi:hypothetical protein
MILILILTIYSLIIISSIISPFLFILIIFYFIVIFLKLNINNTPLYIFYSLIYNKVTRLVIYFSN